MKGIVVPVALIREIAQQSLDPKAKELPNPWSSHGLLIKSLKEKPELKWSNPLELKNQVDALYTENFGTRDECNKRLKEAAKNSPKVSVTCTYLLKFTKFSLQRNPQRSLHNLHPRPTFLNKVS